MTGQEAERILRSVSGYEWLLDDGRTFWTPLDLEPFLGVSANTVRRWADQGLMPGAIDLGGAGFRIPRAGIMIFLATRMPGQQKQHA